MGRSCRKIFGYLRKDHKNIIIFSSHRFGNRLEIL